MANLKRIVIIFSFQMVIHIYFNIFLHLSAVIFKLKLFFRFFFPTGVWSQWCVAIHSPSTKIKTINFPFLLCYI